MDREAEHVQLLLGEKAYIEQRITSNLDLSQKVVGAGFSAVVTALGWVFTVNMGTPSRLIILLAIVSVSAISLLMAVIYQGYALGGIRFKEDVLGAELEAIVLTDSRVFGVLRATHVGIAGRLISFATSFLYLAYAGLVVAVYIGTLCAAGALSSSQLKLPFAIGAIIGGVMLAGSILSLSLLFRAVRKTQEGGQSR